MATSILEGIKVLDLSRVLAAPLAAQMLSDLGADVIKVEKPGLGDDTRRYGPPFIVDPATGEQTAAFFLSCNRGKKSVAIDFSQPEGADLVRRLAAECDVLIENFKVGSLARVGLDYASLAASHPRLIYCSVTGFGQTGPYAPLPGYDAIFQAVSGMMSTNGHADDAPGGGPMRSGVSLGDVLTSYNVSTAVLGALYARDARGGAGQHIDISLLDCTLAALSHAAQNYLVAGERPPRRGNTGYGAAPTNTFACQDGLIIVSGGSDTTFAPLCRILGHEELIGDPRFATMVGRLENREVLLDLMKDMFLGGSRSDWLAKLDAAGVPAGRVNELDEAFKDPQIVHRGMRVQAQHPDFGEIDLLANPINFSGTPISGYEAPPARLAEHTAQVLSETLGLGAAEVRDLVDRGVIQSRPRSSVKTDPAAPVFP